MTKAILFFSWSVKSISSKSGIEVISSLVIYNIEKRIQEDHLQNIALFSEYSKIAKDN